MTRPGGLQTHLGAITGETRETTVQSNAKVDAASVRKTLENKIVRQCHSVSRACGTA